MCEVEREKNQCSLDLLVLYCLWKSNSARRRCHRVILSDGSVISRNQTSAAWSMYTMKFSYRRHGRSVLRAHTTANYSISVAENPFRLGLMKMTNTRLVHVPHRNGPGTMPNQLGNCSRRCLLNMEASSVVAPILVALKWTQRGTGRMLYASRSIGMSPSYSFLGTRWGSSLYWWNSV